MIRRDHLTPVLFWNLLVLLAVAPLPLGGNRTAAWGLFAVWLAGLLLLWGLGAAQWADRVGVGWRRLRPLTILVAAVIVWALVQALLWAPSWLAHPLWRVAQEGLGAPGWGRISAAPEATLAATAKLLMYLGVFWLAAQCCRDRSRARQLLWVVAVSGFGYAAYGIFVEATGGGRILWLTKWAYLDALTSTFVNRNSYATFAGLGLLTCLALARANLDMWQAQRADKYLVRILLLAIAALVIAAALFLTHSRGGLIAAIAGVAALVATGVVDRRRMPGSTRLFALLAGGAVLVGAVLYGGGVAQRFADDDPARAETQRGLIWGQTAAAIVQRPLVGHGLGAYEAAFPAYQAPPQIFAARVDKAHNTYLELAFELGVPMALVWLAAPLLVLALCAAALTRRAGDPLAPALALASGVLVGVHALADFSLQIPAVAMTWAALLGAGFAQALPQVGPDQRNAA